MKLRVAFVILLPIALIGLVGYYFRAILNANQNVVVTLATLSLVWVTTIYVFLTGKLAKATEQSAKSMEISAHEAKRMADAAERSVDVAIEQLRMARDANHAHEALLESQMRGMAGAASQRPFLSLHLGGGSQGGGQEFRFIYTVKNIGDAIAQNARIESAKITVRARHGELCDSSEQATVSLGHVIGNLGPGDPKEGGCDVPPRQADWIHSYPKGFVIVLACEDIQGQTHRFIYDGATGKHTYVAANAVGSNKTTLS